MKKLTRLHLTQQATERQHAENFIHEAKKVHDEQPVVAYVDIDPQSTWAGNTPKLMKERHSTENTVIENRNIGARVVCGPIDEYVSICTNDVIPGGANVLIEVSRYLIEYLAKRLQEFDMILPKKIGFQFDNSGENKVSLI
jgi:hypothetical protein